MEELLNELQHNEFFIFVMGSTGSGKNYIVNKYLSNYPLVDIDKYMAEFAGTNGDTRKYISKSVAIASKELTKHFKRKQTVVQVGTGGNLKGLENKIKLAQDYGLKTALILVDSGVKKSKQRNIERAKSGEQRLVPDWKVEVSYKSSKENFNKLKDIVEISLNIKN